MSGALIQLVSKGAQDMYFISDEGHSFFRMKFMRHRNFSQAPKFIKTISDKDASVTIPVLGDVMNALWIDGNNSTLDMFYKSTIDLYIGGQKIDSQSFDYYADIWPNYLADTYSKSRELNNNSSSANPSFVPLQFFFCNHKAFLPLVALQNHQVEIKIHFNETSLSGISETDKRVDIYGNYIFLDKDEREDMVKRNMDFVITQVQKSEHELNTTDGYNTIDISQINHPVKSLFFGFDVSSDDYENDFFTFSGVDLHINGTPLFENMKPGFFHTIQNYYRSEFGVSEFNSTLKIPFYTRYYVYHFCLNASKYEPSGTCNFSRLDNAKLIIRGARKGSLRPSDQTLFIYALNYNILRIKNGLAGVLFGN